MVDRGHELTEEMLQQLEGKIAEEFAVAVRDMEEKLQKYLEESEKKRQYWEGLLNEGKITRKEYQDWCYKQAMVGKRWEAMRDTLAQDMHHANEVALRMATGRMPDVYALNHNYGLYEIERASGMNTGLTLYNHDTAAYLLREDRQLMPGPSAKKAKEIAANKDMQWNQKKIQSAVLQGVLQGEGPSAVAKRLMKVGEMNYSAAVRYARTMTTSAQNAGRYESYHRANRLGIPLTIEWQAVLDSHTRHDHRMMHGQRRNIDEPFMTPDGFQIYYPADSRPGISTAPQSQIWNCRCTLRAWVKGHEGETVTQSAGLGGQTFEEWLEAMDHK